MTKATRYTALLDANILVSMVLTDLFVQLVVEEVYLAKWTTDIHREWMAAVRKRRPKVDIKRLQRRRDQINAEAKEPLITGYEWLIDSLSLSDVDDRHVLAAAIVGNCDVIVTYNIKHFPAEILGQHEIEAQHPDTFLANQLIRFPSEFCTAIKKILARLKNPPYSLEQYFSNLLQHNLVLTVAALQKYTDDLA